MWPSPESARQNTFSYKSQGRSIVSEKHHVYINSGKVKSFLVNFFIHTEEEKFN
jgi:hypothetical protein